MKRMDGWGVTGWSNVWTALGSDALEDGESEAALDGYGVQRTVDPGVVYVGPPELAEVPRWHAKRAGKGRVYEMQWREDNEPATRSLLDIQQVLATKRQALTADDPDLAALDAGVAGLLSAAAALHAGGASLGFVQPDSCRVGTLRDGSPFVVLPDVGFAWDKRTGLMPPRWIAAPPLELLFEQGAARRNEDHLAELSRRQETRDIRTRATEAAASELADVKILARLVAVALVGADEVRRWCGARKCLHTLPAKDVARDTQADIWDKVIAPALDGQVRTCDELRTRLGIYKPSSHYLHVPPTPPWSGWPMVRRGAAVATAAAVVGLLYLAGPHAILLLTPETAPYCRLVPKDNPLFARLVQLKAAHDAARGDVGRRPEFWGLLRECHGEHAEFKPCGRDCLGGLVAEWGRQAEEEGLAVRQRLRERPRPTPDEARDIAEAIALIRQAEAFAKRPTSSSVEPLLERELRRRGGIPVESRTP